MKKVQTNLIYRLLQFIIAIVLLLSFFLSYVYFPANSYWYYFFLNITTDLVVLLFATFIVERAIENYKRNEEEQKWFTARSYAHKDIGNLVRGLATTILIYTQTDFNITDASQQTKEANVHLLSKIDQLDEQKLKNFFEFLSNNGEEVKKAVNRDKEDLESTVSLYKDVLPPHLLHPLWAIRSSMNRFYITFTESYDILASGRNQEPNIELNQSINELAMQTCKKSLISYIDSLKRLLKTIGTLE